MTNQEKKNLLITEKQNLLVKVADNDYKNLKNGEAERAGNPVPYDPKELYAEDQEYRKRINEIETEMAAIPDDEPDGAQDMEE